MSQLSDIKKGMMYEDDDFVVVKDEFEQLRKFIGVYIGQGGQTGAMHLLNEILTNSIDEAINKKSPCDTIWVYFDEALCQFIIEDNGRGISFDRMIQINTQKHSSTKIDRKDGNPTGGQNGVGIKATVALSDYYSMTSYRGYEEKTLEFFDGDMKEHPIKDLKKEKHGTKTIFVPSRKYLGSFRITTDMVEDHLRRLCYIMPSHMKIKYTSKSKKGKIVENTYKYLGLTADVEYLSQTLLFSPILIKMDDFTPNDKGDKMYFEMAFSYDSSLNEVLCDSYCNYVSTKEGGYHEVACQRALCDFLSRQAKQIDPNHKYEITFDDCRNGLILAVNCHHTNPQFEGQHKSKVDNRDIASDGRQFMYNALVKYFETNNALLRKIILYLRQIAKIRLESNKIKTATLKKATSFIDDADTPTFRNVSDRNSKGYKELLLTEGDSASAAVDSARNVKYQAIYGITGVVGNTYGVNTAKVISSQYASLIKVLGCGIGKDFDINKLKWDAIIIATDGDTDGDNITSLLCTFFACHMPEIIKAGKLYKAVPPLYLLNTSKVKKYYSGKDYMFDKKEYFGAINKMVADNMDIGLIQPKTKNDIVKGNGKFIELNKKERLEWLNSTNSYLTDLEYLAKRTGCDEFVDVLEMICYFIIMTHPFDSNNGMSRFMDLLHMKYPELVYDIDIQSISGSINKEHFTLIIDDIFQNMAKRFLSNLNQQESFYVACKNKNSSITDPKTDDWDRMTLGQFLSMCNGKFMIDIEQRFKGLGESEAPLMFKTMMNPKMRKLIRITMNDAKKAMETIKLLHGDSPQMREARRKLLDDADITIDDIDN